MKCSPCILGHNSFLVDESGHTNLSTDNDAFLRTLKCVADTDQRAVYEFLLLKLSSACLQRRRARRVA